MRIYSQGLSSRERGIVSCRDVILYAFCAITPPLSIPTPPPSLLRRLFLVLSGYGVILQSEQCTAVNMSSIVIMK